MTKKPETSKAAADKLVKNIRRCLTSAPMGPNRACLTSAPMGPTSRIY
jgi:hypothetical protein